MLDANGGTPANLPVFAAGVTRTPRDTALMAGAGRGRQADGNRLRAVEMGRRGRKRQLDVETRYWVSLGSGAGTVAARGPAPLVAGVFHGRTGRSHAFGGVRVEYISRSVSPRARQRPRRQALSRPVSGACSVGPNDTWKRDLTATSSPVTVAVAVRTNGPSDSRTVRT